MKIRPLGRANGAEGTSPGQRPGYRSRLSSALNGRKESLRPFRAHRNRSIPKPRALPWADIRRRFQRFKFSIFVETWEMQHLGLHLPYSFVKLTIYNLASNHNSPTNATLPANEPAPVSQGRKYQFQLLRSVPAFQRKQSSEIDPFFESEILQGPAVALMQPEPGLHTPDMDKARRELSLQPFAAPLQSDHPESSLVSLPTRRWQKLPGLSEFEFGGQAHHG